MSVALFIRVTDDHLALSIRPGVAFTVTPPVGTMVVVPAPV